MTKWYQLRVTGAELSPEQTFMYFYQIEKNELFISPHLKLAGFDKVAHIESKKLALAYLEKCLPIFKKRYGEFTEIHIDEWESPSTDYPLFKRIAKDSLIIEARIKQNNFLSNKKVTL